MKLDYGCEEELTQLLYKQGHRIELHICRTDAETFSIIALSGPDKSQPSRCKEQGPFHDKAQAHAACSAIALSLQESGYTPSDEALIWQIPAQAALRKQRNTRAANPVNTEFIPLGIPPEKP